MSFLLDTNIVSHIFRKHPQVLARLVVTPAQDVAVSAVTAAEIRYGLAKKPQAAALHRAAHEFFKQVRIIPFDNQVAEAYGVFRVRMEQSGRNLASLDLMIAAHAHHLDRILISNDRAFFKIDGLRVQDWTLAV